MQPALSPRQSRFLTALLVEPTVAAAAQVAGCSERTAYAYLAEPGFQAEYRRLRREALSRAAARLQAATTEAVETLRTVMTGSEMPAHARVSAARSVLDSAFKAAELEDVLDRLEQLEARLPHAAVASSR